MGWLKSLIPKQETPTKVTNAPKGVYLYGGVGCGKSFLMDLFFNHTPLQRKRRVHFHHFMHDVHGRIHEWRQHKLPHAKDPLPVLAAQLTKEAFLLCFDEFQVTDVADAMILNRLFSYMFDYGAVLVATSNRMPTDLYKGGLQRDLFLPFIDLLQQKCLIHDLNSGHDYRLSGHVTSRVYFSPTTPDTDKKMEELFTRLSHNQPVTSKSITVHGRITVIPKAARHVAMVTFADLCEKPLGAADYIELSKHFHTILVKNIPRMTGATRNEARRFITLIDVLYEHKVKFICSSNVPAKELFELGEISHDSTSGHVDEGISIKMNPEQQKVFSGEEEKFMFARCCSRIEEMQTDAYLQSAHSPPQ